jgi:hypothetical protein
MSEQPRSDRAMPTADDFAGIPVSREEQEGQLHAPRAATGRGKELRQPILPCVGPPSADDLAGIPATAEGEEDLTARPRKQRP